LARDAGLGDLDAVAVAESAANGDPAAQQIWHEAIAVCAAGVANLALSFSPSLVVIGGGLGRRTEFFDPLRQLVLGRRAHLPDDLDVVPSTLGDDAGLVGAAHWEARSPSRR
jgi:glucokinase